MGEPLSPEAATQIALLNNPSLQAEFEQVGIAQADLVQAGLLANPRLFASARFPDRPPSAADTEFSVTQNFLDLFLLAARKKLASTQLQQTQLRVSHAVLTLAGQVQSAYYMLQAAQQSQALREQAALAAKAAADVAGRQHQAGNINDLDLRIEQAAYQRSRLEVLQGQSQVVAARESLRLLMGFPDERTAWSTAENLPELPESDVPQEDLEALALAQRLDLAAARSNVIEPAIALARWGLLGSVNIGVDTERNPDRQNVTGPQLELDIPIFDQHQAAIARLEAQLRQYHRRVETLEVEVRSQVRRAYIASHIGGPTGYGGMMVSGFVSRMPANMGFASSADLAPAGATMTVRMHNQAGQQGVFHMSYLASSVSIDPQTQDVTVPAGQQSDVQIPCPEVLGMGNMYEPGSAAAVMANSQTISNMFAMPAFLNLDYRCGQTYDFFLQPDTGDINQNGNTQELVVMSAVMQFYMSQGGMMGAPGMMHQP